MSANLKMRPAVGIVGTVELDEEMVRQYIRDQDKEDQRREQLNMAWSDQPPKGGS